MRVFIAVDVDNEAKSQIYSLYSPFVKEYKGIKWVSKENLHITLSFLGDVNEDRIVDLKSIIDEIPILFGREFLIDRISAFPNIRNPKVIWCGASRDYLDLYEYRKRLVSRLKGSGFDIDDKRFIPHITIGRVKKNGPFNVVNRIGDICILANLTSVTLYQSILSPQGASYIPLHKK